VQNEHCLVHAGDTYIISKNAEHLKLLTRTYERYNAHAIFIAQEIENPRQYGVIEADEIEKGILRRNLRDRGMKAKEERMGGTPRKLSLRRGLAAAT